MELKIAWWNCHLSAPASKATPRKMTTEFVTVILSMLDSGVDLLCLCEVNEDNCVELARHILAASLIDQKYASYTVRSLYSKDGNKIDDYGVVSIAGLRLFLATRSDLPVHGATTRSLEKILPTSDLRAGSTVWQIVRQYLA